MGGADKDAVSPSGTLLTAGSAMPLSDSAGDGQVDGPPVVVTARAKAKYGQPKFRKKTQFSKR